MGAGPSVNAEVAPMIAAATKAINNSLVLPRHHTEVKSIKEFEMVVPLVKAIDRAEQQGNVRALWPTFLKLAKQFFVKLLDACGGMLEDGHQLDDEKLRGQLLLREVYDQRREASLQLYKKTLDKCKRDLNFREVMRSVREAQAALVELQQEDDKSLRTGIASGSPVLPRTAKQTKDDVFSILKDAVNLKERFDTLLKQLQEKTGAQARPAENKRLWRILEKLLLDHPEVLESTDDDLKASTLCDVLRGSMIALDMAQLDGLFSLLVNLDPRIGQEVLAGGMKSQIEIVRFKERMRKPTAGGWADIMINFRFLDDPSMHVCEMQMQLEPMYKIRSAFGAHKDFAVFRTAAELLTVLGQPPEEPTAEEVDVDGQEAAEAIEMATRQLTTEVHRLRRQHLLLEARITELEAAASARAAADRQSSLAGGQSNQLEVGTANRDSVHAGYILGMGSPLLDTDAIVDLRFIDKYKLQIDVAEITSDRPDINFEELYDELKTRGREVNFSAGGATQNTIRIAQWMSGTPGATVFVGAVGDDEESSKLERLVRLQGVHTEYLKLPGAKTGRCAVSILNTGIRGQEARPAELADLQAATKYPFSHFADYVKPKLLPGASIVYSSGYFLTVCPQAFVEAGKYTVATGKTFGINLAAPFICEHFTDQLNAALYYANFVFGNESEICTYARSQKWGRASSSAQASALRMAGLPCATSIRPRVVVITQGNDSTLVASCGVVSAFPVCKIPQHLMVDAHGGGDGFAGAFLATLRKGGKISECVEAGHFAARVICMTRACQIPALCLAPMFLPTSCASHPLILGFGNPMLMVAANATPALWTSWAPLRPGVDVLAMPKHRPLLDELHASPDSWCIRCDTTLDMLGVSQQMSAADRSVAFIGSVGDDEDGGSLEEVAQKYGVSAQYMRHTEPTGKCAVLIEGGVRGTCCDLRAAQHYDRAAHFDTAVVQEMVEAAKLAYVSSAFVHHDGGYETALALGSVVADKSGLLLCVDLMAPFDSQHAERMAVVLRSADVILATEAQAFAYAAAVGWSAPTEPVPTDPSSTETDLIKQIANKLAQLPKASEKRPRLVVIARMSAGTIVRLSNAGQILDTFSDYRGTGRSIGKHASAFFGGFMAKLAAGGLIKECMDAGHFACQHFAKPQQ